MLIEAQMISHELRADATGIFEEGLGRLNQIHRRLLLKASARENRAALDRLRDHDSGGHRADQLFENFDPGYDWRDDVWSRRHGFTGEEVIHVDQPPSA